MPTCLEHALGTMIFRLICRLISRLVARPGIDRITDWMSIGGWYVRVFSVSGVCLEGGRAQTRLTFFS